MIVRNEENYLRDCLESVKNIADEIILVDTGSADHTLEIARQYKAKIYYFEWVNDFSAARNFALSKSSGKWILYLDADERLNVNSIQALEFIIKKEEKAGYRCEVISKNSYKNSSQMMYYTRLFFNTPGIKFTGTIHEQIDNSLIENNYSFYSSDIQIDHIGYDLSVADIRSKAERNLSYLLAEYSTNPSSYNAYQIGNTYLILNDEQKAFNYYNRTIDDVSFSAEYKSIGCLHMSSFKISHHELQEALYYCKMGLKANPQLPQLHLISSEINFRMGRINEACKECLNSFELNKDIHNGKHKSNQINASFDLKKPIYQGLYISISAENTEWREKFFLLLKEIASYETELIEKIFSNESISENEKIEFLKIVTDDNLQCLLAILEKYKYPDKIMSIADFLADNYPENSKVFTFSGRCYSESGDKERAKMFLEKALAVNLKDPSAVFYLISVLLELNELSRIQGIIAVAQKEFRQIPEVISRISILKNKLLPYIDTTGLKK